MIVMDQLLQGTDAWLRERAGVLTASAVDKLLTKTLKLSSQREDLLDRLAGERILGIPLEDWGGNFHTEQGSRFEGEAGDYFALVTDLEPKAVGFVYKDEKRLAGCSPDWMVADSGGDWIAGVEQKVPKTATHIGYLRGHGFEKYLPQLQYSLWVTQLPVWYFLSYNQDFPPVLRRVEPDPAFQDAFNEHVPRFLDELAEAETQLRARMAH